MAINLSKGENVCLTKDNPALKNLIVGLGWDTNENGGPAFDLDASCFAITDAGKVRSNSDFIYYGNLRGCDTAIVHNGDNLTGAGDGDDEQIEVNLEKLPENIQKLIFVVTIYEAKKRHQNFGQVNNAKIHIVDKETKTDLASYDLTEELSGGSSMIFGEVYRHNGEWKFKAIGIAKDGGLGELAESYGVN